jgi:universal stress protein A
MDKEVAMFTKILIPTDLSEKSEKALDIALKMCSTDDHRVYLLHVIETLQGDDEEEFQSFYDKLKERAVRRMGMMVKKHAEKADIIETEVAYGNRSLEIIRFAQDYHIDLIVLSSHRIENVEPSDGWATISYKVGILSPCPVLLVK